MTTKTKGAETVPALLGRDGILAARDEAYEDVPVPEWGGVVRVKAMTGEQRDAYEAAVTKRDKNGNREVDGRNFRAKLVARVCVDEKGARLFSDEDVSALARKSAAPLERLFDVGMRLAGMRDADVRSLEGNSDGQSGASTSA